MQAIRHDRYGSPDVLRVEDVERPVPGPKDVLVRVRAASLNPADRYFLRGEPYFLRLFAGLFRPREKGLGADIAGEVVAIGEKVEGLAVGDDVYGSNAGGAGFAEYAVLPAATLARKPTRLDFVEAAALPMAATTALQALQSAGVAAGERVLVHGASGGVGTSAVQLARALGAHVTAVCSARNVELVRSLGADEVIDYTRDENGRDLSGAIARGLAPFDVMLDTVGNLPLAAWRRLLTRRGRYVVIGGPDGRILGPLARLLGLVIRGLFLPQRVVPLFATTTTQALDDVTRHVDAGALRPILDRRVSLQGVPEAICYLETRRARGKIVVEI
jgi:NADPH:quinone reductase-like Zn-dependent oxidoreductase